MLRGYRRIILAAVGWLILGFSPPPSDNSKPPPAPSRKVEHSLENIASSLKKANDPSVLEQPCEKGRDNRQSDLCAQWKAADAAASAANATWLFGGLGSLIGALTLAAAWSAAKWAKKAALHTETGATEANRAANAAEETLKEARASAAIQLRPYVSFTMPNLTDTAPFSRQSKLYFTIKNFGAIPAENVLVRAGALMVDRPIGNPEIPLDKSGMRGRLAPGDFRDDFVNTRELPPAVFGTAAGGAVFMLRLRLEYSWSGGIDAHEVVTYLSDPASNEWMQLTDFDRQRPK